MNSEASGKHRRIDVFHCKYCGTKYNVRPVNIAFAEDGMICESCRKERKNEY